MRAGLDVTSGYPSLLLSRLTARPGKVRFVLNILEHPSRAYSSVHNLSTMSDAKNTSEPVAPGASAVESAPAIGATAPTQEVAPEAAPPTETARDEANKAVGEAEQPATESVVQPSAVDGAATKDETAANENNEAEAQEVGKADEPKEDSKTEQPEEASSEAAQTEEKGRSQEARPTGQSPYWKRVCDTDM
ncbi:hypothetical protein K470DRAFT_89095 [Piedraia hortae CBS 480.64]|uniref:Uncharacterized protein n=1 Tax=Piedraia hortae CBS 480.64 TaxID=1314780 RepID=A0A6A7BXH0_9PEZI|nr:hypothetical protein K470DRAFT_89095 [Piedraia hortae CBS 480.64]